MAGFFRVSGAENIEHIKKTASTAFAPGMLVNRVSAYALPADATSGDHIGVCMQTFAATDATNDTIMVDVAGENDIFEVGCAVSTLATLTALIGTYIDLTSSTVADATASSKDALLVVGVLSTSKILVKIASRENILRTATT